MFKAPVIGRTEAVKLMSVIRAARGGESEERREERSEIVGYGVMMVILRSCAVSKAASRRNGCCESNLTAVAAIKFQFKDAFLTSKQALDLQGPEMDNEHKLSRLHLEAKKSSNHPEESPTLGHYSSMKISESTSNPSFSNKETDINLTINSLLFSRSPPPNTRTQFSIQRPGGGESRGSSSNKERWFPYLDRYKCGDDVYLSSGEVVEAVGPYLMKERRERFVRVAKNRSYSVCLVVEGLSDFGNVSAAFRSADALGVQSVHVVSCNSSKRYRENRHVSMGAEKWLDIELWDSPQECFEVLRSRGYRIATTHVGMDAVSIYDMDWSCPTAIVVGNENRGISDEALQLSDLHCSIPMKGMVDSFNVSVAAGILMHHAVCDRVSRLGSHGDLTLEEKQILFAEFSLRHSKSAISIAHDVHERNFANYKRS
ncbi:hypothetical protein JRO89_XS12G0230800 [Xanthoceras sorbifolium]|uniref:tRNA/rRNA methyltransferase SpoU type domain-containing protein n=1 Tax=Xanthoceras sorbifolium TaxID=99658 RepID=A0ABQ8HDG6_9ROSI|nr:hypothetical protein JRO89_XS12G0230800 [Xanthoceras sorbifolium]